MKKIKQTVEKINDSKGFVSVEYIIIAGVVVALGVVITYFLATKGRGIASLTGSTLDDVNSKLGGQNIGDGIKVGGNTSGSTSGGKTSGETDSNSSQTNKSKVTKGADGKYYQDGSPFTGVNPDDGKTYKNGDPLTGVSDTDGKYYKNGVIFTGTENDIYYKDGKPFTGTKDSLYYQDGKPFTGSANGKNYVKGVEDSYPANYTGYKDNGQHYTNGVEDTTNTSNFIYVDGEEDGTVEITGYESDYDTPFEGASIIIPSKIDGKTVTGIGKHAFEPRDTYDTDDYQDGLGKADIIIGKITMPNTITVIRDDAFRNTDLKFVKIPSSVKTIGKNAFQDAELQSVTIPSSVTKIGESAFESNKIDEVNFAENGSLKQIPRWAFRNNNITSLEIPSYITNIGMEAFSNNPMNSLDLSNLSNDVVIVDYAFGNTRFYGGIDDNKILWWSGADKSKYLGAFKTPSYFDD